MPIPSSLVRSFNWINLSTPCGLLLARRKGCSVSRGPHGLLLAEGFTGSLPKARAFTVGSVVFLRGSRGHASEALLAHESRHALQYAICGGLPFFPLYFAAVAWSLLRTGDPASRNAFERAAGLSDGGYRERPPRGVAIRRPGAIQRPEVIRRPGVIRRATALRVRPRSGGPAP